MRASARIARVWRVLRTGVGFATFGVAALALAWLILPLVRWRAAGARDAERRARHAICSAYRFEVWLWQHLGLLNVRVVGAERLHGPGPRLIAANHPTLIDFVVLGSLLPGADCIVEASWAEHPVLRRTVRAARYLRNDGGMAMIDEAARRLRGGGTLVVFPEGSRSPGREVGPFRRGAARIALAAGCEIWPVAITCEPPTLKRGQRWHDVPTRPFELELRVLDPIAIADHGARDLARGAAARRLTEALRLAIAAACEDEATAGGAPSRRAATA